MIYYDFHIHSALSPCADDDMTPNNIVNMAVICGLDAIAVCDHSTCKNLPAVFAAAEKIEGAPVILPGMELETQEEIHLLCFFPTLELAMEFDKFVDKRRSPVKNRPSIFGNQLIMDEYDNITGEFEPLLLIATSIGVYEAIKHVKSMGGTAIPAHIDREANGALNALGFLPADLGINMVEYSKNCDPFKFYEENAKRLPKRYHYLQSSDAHNLVAISDRRLFLDLPEGSSAGDIISHLLGL